MHLIAMKYCIFCRREKLAFIILHSSLEKLDGWFVCIHTHIWSLNRKIDNAMVELTERQSLGFKLRLRHGILRWYLPRGLSIAHH